MSKLGRPSKKDQYKDQIHDLYYTQGMSLSQISREIGPAAGTISRWFKDWGWSQEDRVSGYNPNLNRTDEQKEEIRKKISETKLRQRNEGVPIGRPKAKRETRACVREGCDNTFEVKSVDPKKYCSRTCNLLEKNPARGQETKEAYANSGIECPCGEPIPYEFREFRKYCNDEHRMEYGEPTATKDPENWGTYTCQYEKCGKTFEQRKGYGRNKYCSVPCAQRHTKKTKHIVVEDADVLDSPYEAIFWGMCSLLRLPVERYDRTHGVAWKGEGSWYAPDFVVERGRRKIAVELKGFEEYDDEIKWAAFREQVMPLCVISKEDLLNLLRDGNANHFIRNKLDNA